MARGWVRDKKGRLRLRDGGRIHKLLRIFANPKLPTIGDYYEPWTYDYENLTSAPAGDTFPTAAPRSLISGNPMKVSWGSNWDDNLAGSPEIVPNDPVLKKVNQVNQEVKLKLEETFMFYLPRICEHCLNPSCVASCPSGAMYKRTEDGIVLVDQDRCRGWRMCVSGCPYKKVYFNHKTGKAEKCTLCYPRIEVGLPTVCSETCVGRLRYLGLVLYDVDQVLQAASVESDTDLYEAQRRILLDPHDPRVIAGARAEGIADEWIEAAQRSPVYALINTYRWRCRYIRSTGPCRWSGTSRRCRRWSTRSAATGTTGGPGQFVRRAGRTADSDCLSGRAVHRGRHRGGRGRVAAAGGDALLHARHQPGPGDPAPHPGIGRDDRGADLPDVPTVGCGEI